MPRFVTFRFDDGFADGAQKVAAIMKPDVASFFIAADRVLGIADLVGNRLLKDCNFGSLAYWRGMSAQGHDIQPHRFSHSDFSALPENRQQREILDSVELISSIHAGPYVFGFPFNNIPNGLKLARSACLRLGLFL